MSYEIVHTFGSTTYFIFVLLFLWASRVPRTNSGAGWWAVSISCALLARLGLFVLLAAANQRLAIAVYIMFNVLEKPFLMTGLVRFLNLSVRMRWFWTAALAAEAWLCLALAADFPSWARTLGYALVNAGFMLCMAGFLLKRRAEFPRLPLTVAAVACAALAVHWLAAPLVLYLFPSWFRNGFVLGTVLVLVQYLSLLAAVLAQFQSRLLEAESKALDLAFLDPLTGLNNKRHVHTLFDQALVLATRPHQVVAVFYIDLDNFKPINDTAGHAAGDEVLKTVAARLKGSTRSTDICARVGGDEFVVIGTQLDSEEQAEGIARKLLAQLTMPVLVNGRSHALGASIGIGLYPRHGSTLPELMQCADQAMYHVKRNGKSGCGVFQGAPAARTA
jgi:diguanylate cyclase (GGDEF)-like protein